MIKPIAVLFALVVTLASTLTYACEVYTILNPDGTYKSCVICGTLISCS